MNMPFQITTIAIVYGKRLPKIRGSTNTTIVLLMNNLHSIKLMG